MTLKGSRVALNATEAVRLDLHIRDGRLSFETSSSSSPVVDLSGHLILPGLINAHDHLEFNLFPRLGNGPYPNATAWAEEIYRPGEPPVRGQLEIPKAVRLLWGGVKNLVAGVTSVLHHNPFEPSVFGEDFPVRVIRNFGWAHSVRFSLDFAERYAATPPGFPFVMHACEGTDPGAQKEIHQLDDAGVLGPSTVLVHGVGLGRDELALVKRRGASLVWCPTSNRFTLGRTLSREALGSGIPIALGTDSGLTAAGDLIDELEAAQDHADLDQLYRMVTDGAAAILGLRSGEGMIRNSGTADMVVVRDGGQKPSHALPELRPDLVITGGRVKLISLDMLDRFRPPGIERFHPIAIEGRGRRMVDCNLPALIEAAKQRLGAHIRLAGKLVAA